MNNNTLYNNRHECYAIILAAGQGNRIAKHIDNAIPKQFMTYCDKPLWWHSLNSFSQCPLISGIILVFSEEYFEKAQIELQNFIKDFSLPIFAVKGGSQRQESVYNALVNLPTTCDIVLIHDAARPFLKTTLITKLVDTLVKDTDDFSGIIPSLPLSDTIKEVDPYVSDTKSDDELSYVVSTLKRENLRAVQTPQAFYKDTLLKAHKNLIENNIEVSDDASAIELINEKVLCIMGDKDNKKITYVEDLDLLQEKKNKEHITTQGYDVHAYVEENANKARPFKLATVPIPSKFFISAHSDGDVLLHALMDALLALIGAGDIGMHFSDKDNSFDNISSAILLDKVLTMLLESSSKIELNHIDVTLIAQQPKISPYIIQIRKALAHLLSLPLEKVNVKSTTEEKLGFTGELKGIKASVLVSATRFS